MSALMLWATFSAGALSGIGVGCVIGFARGKSDGVEVGRSLEMQENATWKRYTDEVGYSSSLPHDDPNHLCTTTCYTQINRKDSR